MAAIELIDGPLKGTIHEVQGGFPVPDAFALPGEDGFLHHYKTDHQSMTASYSYKSESMRHSRIEWHCVADESPEIPKGHRCVAVLVSRKGQQDSWVALWHGHKFTSVSFKQLPGEVYAWAYLPNAAPWIEPETET